MAVAASASLLVVGTSSAEAAAKYYTVIAHRGDADAAPENTVPAFTSAIAKGTDAIEFDVHYSSSKYPVVIHDATLDRTTNCSGKVSSKSRTQLAKCDAGSWFGSQFKGTRIPTLEHALSAVKSASPSVRVILHMKVTPDSTRAKRTMDAVKRYGMQSRTIVLASNSETFSKMKSAGFSSSRFAYIFNTQAGWDKKYPIMIPYNTPAYSNRIATVHSRGGVVWPVESHPASLRSILTQGQADGILTNHLTALLGMLGSPDTVRASSAEPKTSAGASRVDRNDDWDDEKTRP